MEHLVQCLHEDRWEDVRACLRRIEAKQDLTNGRVGRLERALIFVAGAMSGIALLTATKVQTLQGALVELAKMLATGAGS